ncbi:MAG: DUF4438 domain-containing protein [Desulfobacteraceae bacterium]
MLETNKETLVRFLLECKPGMPRVKKGWNVDDKGNPFILPSIGGITLNIKVGDSAFNISGDHVEPGVSCTANAEKFMEFPNNSLQLYSCVGNQAKIISGDAKGAIGVVTGHHGGSEHIMIDFEQSVMEKLSYDDRIQVTAEGQGLALKDFPDIRLFNLDPGLLGKIGAVPSNKGTLKVPVTTLIPPECMGSGVGAAHTAAGDYDVMTSDPATVQAYKLDQMRFGDFVAIMDHDNSYGRAFVKGAVTIGIVVHSDCRLAGHGPGISTLMTSCSGSIEPAMDAHANIAEILKIGSFRSGE